MDSIYKLQQRASALRNKTQIDSITPEEVGGLHTDTLAYIADMEQNLDGLGIRKVYVSVAAMENDKTAPIGTNGKPLRLGQLVTIYNASAPAVGTGNVYAFQKPGWLLIGNISDISELKALVEIEATARESADNNLEMQLTHLNSGCIYRGYVNEGTTLPSDDNSFYFTNDPGNYIDSDGNAVTVATEGVSLIQRKGGEWKVYALWELVSELNNASSTRFASAKAVKILKDMIDQLAAFGGAEGTIPIDSKLSLESIYPVQNAVITSAIYRLERTVFPLEVTLTVAPSIEEYTGSNKDFTISWTMKIAGETVSPSKLELKVGNDVVPVDIEDVSKIVSVNNDKQVTLIVEADGRAATKTANINFARRYYSAVVDSSWTATNDTVKALAKSALKSAAAATVAYSAATQKKIVFAYPVSHGLMSTIKDAYGNSMFALNDSGKTFNTAPKTVTVTLSGGATLDYYVYESVITNVVAGNITYTTKTFD